MGMFNVSQTMASHLVITTLPQTSKQIHDENISLQYLNKISQIVEGYIFPSIFLFGICGNALSFVIFIRSKKIADASLHYLAFLAVADSGVILTLGFEHWVTYGLTYATGGAVSLKMFTQSSFSCKFLAFLLHVFECTSAWLIMTFSLERAYIVWFPLKRPNITPRRRLIVIIAIIIFAVSVSLHRLFLFDVYVESDIKDSAMWCYYALGPSLGFWIYQWDTGMHNYIPIPVIILANLLILIGINNAKRSFKSQSEITRNTHHENRVVISLLLVSTFYIIFMLPASASFSYNLWLFQFPDSDTQYLTLIHFVVTFCDQFSMLNYCFNFIVYGCTMPFFRQSAREILRIGCRKK
jgi:hypothetical protein